MEFLRSLLGCHLAWKPVGWRREMSAVFSGHDIWVFQAADYNLRVWKNWIKKNSAFWLKKNIYIYIYRERERERERADFFITNLTKSAVIWVKSRQKPGFLRPISSKVTPAKEKEGTKSKSKEGERRRREKTMDALLVFIMAALKKKKKKNCWMEEVYLAITFPKTRLDTY